MAKCAHNWKWEHTIYRVNGKNGGVSTNGFAVHRQCSRCGKHQMARVVDPPWRFGTSDYSGVPNLVDTESHRS